MNRRSAISRVGLIMGATIISADVFLSCKSDNTQKSTSEKSNALSSFSALITEIGHTILPATEKHPGYKAINGTETTIAILNDCYKKEKVQELVSGIESLEASVQKSHNKSFVQLSDEEKYTVLNDIDKKYFDKATKEADKPTYYGTLKEAILLTYFTDKKVLEGPMSYKKVPGKYDGAMKIEKGSYSVIYGLGA
jgi:Gluconate 2-dehydrogenase subunit 3